MHSSNSTEQPVSSIRVTIYTDGSARGNPGPGGYGAILKSGNHYKELSAGYRLTTNNRMELLAVIMALEQLRIPNSQVTVFTDSKYVCEAVEKKWLFGWEKTGFKNKKNPDLWLRFLKIFRQHQVTFKWLKGHAGHLENERCDELATAAADGKNLKVDEIYERERNKEGLL